MAKLSTPYHPCHVHYVDEHGAPTGGRCPFAAYRRDLAGRWACRRHQRERRARVAREAATTQPAPMA